ncbi:MAG: hypothetical protein ABSB91_02230 [Sedimentisphaerales bacterium]|jgi:hypothetical protein
MNDIEFRKFLWLSSVPLVRLNKKGIPSDMGSGCFIDYCGKRILLTVSHLFKKYKKWAIQLKYILGKGVEPYPLSGMNFLAEGSLSETKLKNIDFSYIEVPSNLCAYRQEVEISQGVLNIKSETQIIVHSPTLTETPKPDDKYGFCGIVMPEVEKHPYHTILDGKPFIYSDLSFIRTKDDYHFFTSPFPKLDHRYFKGCSGAPIFSSSGSLVALVCGGCKKTNEIYGISVSAFKIQIDILVGNI